MRKKRGNVWLESWQNIQYVLEFKSNLLLNNKHMNKSLNSKWDSPRKLDWGSRIPVDISKEEFITLLWKDINNPLYSIIINWFNNWGLTPYWAADLIQKEKYNPWYYQETMRTIHDKTVNMYTDLLVKKIQEDSKK